jgi:serine/threonine-protein kinase
MAENEQPGPDKSDAAAKARAASFVGRVIADRYRIDELLALGGMGAVYRGEHLRMHKRIAIKLLHPDIEDRPELVDRFEREAIAGAQLSHPNIATATDIGELEGGSTFLVLEYVAGETLQKAMKAGAMPPLRAVRIGRQLADVLAAVHAAGIVHRDVKPNNVILVDGTDDLVKLIDFGLAKISEDSLPTKARDERARRAVGPLTADGLLLGTVAYLAPEAALGMGAVDARSDLYALGVILYQMLSGKHPFGATEPAALFKQHRFDKPPPMSVRAPGVDVPPALEAIALRLLAKAPAERFPNGEAVVAALDRAMMPPSLAPPSLQTAEPVADDPEDDPDDAPEVTPQPAPSPPRNRASAPRYVVLAGIVLAGALLARGVLWRRPPRSSARAPTAANVTTAAPQTTPSEAPPASAPAPSAPAAPDERPASLSADPAPSTAPSASSPTAPSDADIRSMRARLVKAAEIADWDAAEETLLALAAARPSVFKVPAIATAAKDTLNALERAGSGRGDRAFEFLGAHSGGDGLDLLYDVMESRGGSAAAKRATVVLATEDARAQETPALRIAFELRLAPCDRKLALLRRAVAEGDRRALVVLETFGFACFGHNERVEAAIKSLRARLNTPPP